MEGLIQGLADAVLWCGSHREELSQIAAKGAEIVALHFGSDRYDEILQHAYKKAIKLQ